MVVQTTGTHCAPDSLQGLCQQAAWNGHIYYEFEVFNTSLHVAFSVNETEIANRANLGVTEAVLDFDLLQLWELEGRDSPGPPVTILGAFIHRKKLDARSIASLQPWAKNFPLIMLCPMARISPRMNLELTYAGVGIAAVENLEWKLLVAPPTIGQLRKKRTIVDRWMEERLFESVAPQYFTPRLPAHAR